MPPKPRFPDLFLSPNFGSFGLPSERIDKGLNDHVKAQQMAGDTFGRQPVAVLTMKLATDARSFGHMFREAAKLRGRKVG